METRFKFSVFSRMLDLVVRSNDRLEPHLRVPNQQVVSEAIGLTHLVSTSLSEQPEAEPKAKTPLRDTRRPVAEELTPLPKMATGGLQNFESRKTSPFQEVSIDELLRILTEIK